MRILIFSLCLGLITACGSSEDVGPDQKRFGRLSYDLGQCEYSPFDGESLSATITGGQPEAIRLFNKSFYPDSLEKTLKASSFSIAQAIHNEGVAIFRVKSKENQDLPCRYFDFLNEATGVAQKNWNDIASPSSTKGSLLGLFTTIYSKNNQNKKTSLRDPTIMVLDQTQKWTLLHEMSHYLFAKARSLQSNLQFNNELETQIKEKAEEIRQIREFLKLGPNAIEARRLAEAYAAVFATSHELDRRTALEEFSIEALLIDYAKQGRIHHIDLHVDHQQAFAYMKSNGEQVAFSYILFLDKLRELETFFKDNFYNEAYQINQDLQKRVQALIDFIDRELKISRQTNPDQPTLQDLAKPQPSHLFRDDQTATDLNSNVNYHHFDYEKFKQRQQILRNL